LKRLNQKNEEEGIELQKFIPYIDDNKKQQRKLINEMNQFLKFVTKGKRENQIAIRVWKEGKFIYEFKTRQAFTEIFSNLREFFVVDPDCIAAAKLLKNMPTAAHSNIPISEHAVVPIPLPRIPSKKGDEGIPKYQLKQYIQTPAEIWLKSRRKEIATEVIFDPSGSQKEGQLNLWTGFKLVSSQWQSIIPESIHLIRPLLHWIKYGVCDNQEQFEDFLYRLALLLEYPFIKQEVVINLVGPQGTGKTLFWTRIILEELIGEEHGMLIHNPKDVVGDFTGILENKVLLILDEARSGTKQEENAAKNISTSKKSRIRPMYEEARMVPHVGNMIVTISNDTKNLILHSEGDTRRVVTYYVDPRYLFNQSFYKEGLAYKKKGTTDSQAFFSLMYQSLMKNDKQGIKAFRRLLERLSKLEEFNFRNQPKTKIMMDNKISKLSPVALWFCNCLLQGIMLEENWREKKQSDFCLEYMHNHFVTDRTIARNKKNAILTPIEEWKNEFFNYIPLYTKNTIRETVIGKGQTQHTITLNYNDCINQMERYVPGLKEYIEKDWWNKTYAQFKEDWFQNKTDKEITEELLEDWIPDQWLENFKKSNWKSKPYNPKGTQLELENFEAIDRALSSIESNFRNQKRKLEELYPFSYCSICKKETEEYETEYGINCSVCSEQKKRKIPNFFTNDNNNSSDNEEQLTTTINNNN